jgi:hypothetical protein
MRPMVKVIPASSKNKEKRRKPGKALENVARQIKDSEEFVGHVASISDRYRREHALDLGSRGRDVRQSLKAFHKHATALATWLRQAHKENRSAAECDALEKLGAALHGAPALVYARSKEVQSWLEQATKAADKCIADSARSSRNVDANAPRIAAEGLRATFERHQLKLSTKLGKDSPSDAVRLLCAVARNAGDAELTAQAARKALVESGRPKSS